MSNFREWISRIKRDSIWSFAIAILKWFIELLFGDFIINFCKRIFNGGSMINLLKWSITNPLVSSVSFFFIVLAFVVLIDYFATKNKNGNLKIDLVPRKNNPEMWGDYIVWLEIIGDIDTQQCVAYLRKLESEKDGAIINHIIQVTNSVAPRLKISGEKLFVAQTKVTDTVIVLENGTSSVLPKASKFYFEIELMKRKELIKKYKGYLIGNYSDLQIKPFTSEN